jgi:hypothetical protein
MILEGKSKQDRRRRQRQLLNTSVQVFTGSAHVDALGINLSDVGMCLFAIAHLPLGSQIQIEFLPPRCFKVNRGMSLFLVGQRAIDRAHAAEPNHDCGCLNPFSMHEMAILRADFCS